MTKTSKPRRARTTNPLLTLQAGEETLRASSDVIAARLEIMARGMADPMQADLAEMSLMGSEKVVALSASAAAVARSFSEMGDQISRSAAAEMNHASRLASDMTSGDPARMASAQMAYAMGWWGRAASQALSLNTTLMRAQAEALKPIHKTATANAKRLKR